MSKKLVQVAAELNVGTKTIVEFLTGKGFEVIDKPTAKISEEMLDILIKNFQKSIAIKEQAEQITIGNRVVPKKEEKPIIKEEPKPLFKKELPVETVVEKVVEQQPVVEEKEYKLSGPKILGKIDLDANRKTTKIEKKEEPIAEIPKIEEKKEIVKTVEVEKEPVVEIKETPKAEIEVKTEEGVDDNHINL